MRMKHASVNGHLKNVPCICGHDYLNTSNLFYHKIRHESCQNNDCDCYEFVRKTK